MTKKKQTAETEDKSNVQEEAQTEGTIKIKVKATGKIRDIDPSTMLHLCGINERVPNPLEPGAKGALVFPLSQYEVLEGEEHIPETVVCI